MKKPAYLLLLAISLLPAAGSAAIEAGRQYVEIPFEQRVETGDKIEVREFFWYGCPHCFRLEPAITRWLKQVPSNAEFVRTPGVAPRWLVHAQAFYAFEALGLTGRLHEAFFDAIHKQKRRFEDASAVADFAARHGVDKEKFLDAFNSFAVRINLEKAKRLNEAYAINSVPTFVIDGKYLTTPSMAGGNEAAMKVVDYLIRKAANERKRSTARH